MNKIFLSFLIMLLCGIRSFAQTVVWSEDFTSGGGAWTLNQNGQSLITGSMPANGSDPNSWIINNDYNITMGPYDESTTIGGSGGNFLHVTCTNMFCGLLFGAPGPAFQGGDPNTNTNRAAILTTAIPGATLTGGPFTLTFNWYCKGEAVGPNPGVGATLIYSINGGPWQEHSTVFKGVTSWQTFSIPLATLGHSSGQSFRIGFRWFNDDNADVEDPPMMIDDIKITSTPASNTITTSPLSSTVLCQTEIFTVNFTSTGTFNAGNVYSVELSDASGSFASPTVIGTLSSTANSGSITCTVPGGATPGSGYRVRVVSSNPAAIGSDNGVNITINPFYNPVVTISASPGTTICAGQLVNFTSSLTGLPITPTYQWQINTGSGFTNIAGATSSTYSTNTLNNGDIIRLRITFSGPCNSGSVFSNQLTFTISGSVTPSVSIAASPGSSICSGQSVTFTATPTNGGSSPTYQWQLNGSNIPGATASTYTTSTLNNNDQIRVIMTSNASCASPTTATSNVITMTVNPNVTPSVSITVSPSNNICSGQSVTFTATPTNGGSSPTYQWQLNGSNIPGATASTYTTSTLNNNDQIRVIMTSNASCASPTTATSNVITMNVGTLITFTPNVVVSPGTTICAGQSITFTEMNNYTNASYQWNVNGNPVPGATTNVFTTNTLNNGDQVTVTLTPTGCGTSATSNAITITVNPTTSTSVNISASPGTTICLGTSVTFTATPTNGGATPSYSWTVNGSAVGTNSPTFTSSTLQNGDIVAVTMQSSLSCTNPATSQVTMTVNNPLPASVNITASTGTTICAGTSVTFTATPTNGGSSPTYQWQLNGVNIPGATSSSYTTTTLNNNDVINVVMTSSLSCVSGSPAFSNNLQFTVNPNVTPGVVISANPNTAVCQGTNITFTATPSNVTNTPSYQWLVNGNPVSGATSSTFVTSSLNNGDVVTVEMTSNDACVTQNPVTSNAISAQINTPSPVSVSIEANDTTICTGTQVQFTATVNNGGSPTYQWQVNGVNQGTNNPIFIYTPSNGDVVRCIVNSSLTCVSNNPDTSDAITMVVHPNPTLTCSANDTILGNPITVTANATGANPITYVYNFGDGNQITSNNPSETHTYSTVGTFIYTVNITDANGCTAVCTGNVNITNIPIPEAIFSTQGNIWSGCAPLTLNFENQSINAVAYEWNFGDGSPTTTTVNPSHTFVNAGVYDMYLVATNNTGVDTAFVTIVVYPNPTAGIQILTNNPNIFEPTQFQDNSSGAVNWEWSFGDPASGVNDTSSLQNPSHQYTSGGTYTVTLVVTNAFGCKDTISTQVNISTVSNDKPSEITNLSVYPNPFKEKIEMKFYSSTTENVEFILYDALGKSVTYYAEKTMVGDNMITWKLEDFATGVYNLVIKQGEKISTVRLVKIQ